MDYAIFLRQHIKAVIALTDEEFQTILPYFSPIKVNKKVLIIEAGQIITSEFLVVKGCLKAFTEDEVGKEYIIQFAMEDWWISDYPALVNESKGDMCVQALEDCLVLELSFDNRKKMCEAVPKMYIFHGQKAFSGYVALQKRVLSMMKNSAKEKYELLLHQYPALFQRVSKTMIAQYLGVSRETLSRLEKK